MRDRTRALIGALLIALGSLFLLDAADVIAAGEALRDWWPLVFVVLGLIALLSRPRSWVGGGILIVIGLVLLVPTLDILDVSVWQLAVPLVLIGIGLSLVIRGLRTGSRDSRSSVNIVSILSDQRVNNESSAFKRANLTSILGETTLDLRNAQPVSSGATIDTLSLLGESNVVVPRGWRVTMNGVPILGEFKDERDRSAEMPDGAPEIAVTGVAILGEVKVKHSV